MLERARPRFEREHVMCGQSISAFQGSRLDWGPTMSDRVHLCARFNLKTGLRTYKAIRLGNFQA